MLFRLVSISTIILVAAAQNCGPSYNNQVCAAGNCCSQYGWCDTDAAHCDPSTCLSKYSGSGSSCANLASSSNVSTLSKSTKTSTSKKSTSTQKSTSSKKTSSATSTKKTSTNTSTKKPTSTSTSTSTAGPYASAVPDIDVCGSASNNISCPGAGYGGLTGYFYRCCSTHGHCGPKNNIQDQDLYCGADVCQPGFGKCDNETAPPNPTGTPGVVQYGDTCGPIVNMRCDVGLCCSGSNYCGNGTDFCGSANWCQKDFGECDSD